MDIPLDYTLVGDERAVQNQIGNALPPGMATVLASHLLEQADVAVDSPESSLTAEADGGQFSTDSHNTEYNIDRSQSPWKLASNIVPLLQKGKEITIGGRGREIATTLDVAELVRRRLNSPVKTEIDVGTEEVDNGKSDELSTIELKLKP